MAVLHVQYDIFISLLYFSFRASCFLDAVLIPVGKHFFCFWIRSKILGPGFVIGCAVDGFIFAEIPLLDGRRPDNQGQGFSNANTNTHN